MIKSLYKSIYKTLPSKGQVLLTKTTSFLQGKPRFNPSKKIKLDKGTLIISADFELFWAWRYGCYNEDPYQMARHERAMLPKILEQLDHFNLPVTWGIIGHLFLDSCERKYGKAHHDIHRPRFHKNEHWNYYSGDWYDCDPCGNYKSNPEFYAPDLIEKILSSNADHEIGSHSFSHIDFSKKNSYDELIIDELYFSNEAMKKFGIIPESFIFPGNQYGNFDKIKSAGYKNIRYNFNNNSEIDFTYITEEGLLALPDSAYINFSAGLWGKDYLIKKYKSYIECAIKNKAICHFWFHPSIDEFTFNEVVIPLFYFIAERINSGQLQIAKMNQIEKLII